MELRMKFLSDVYPISDETFTDEAHDARIAAISAFLKVGVNTEEHPKYRKQLEELINDIVKKYQKMNEDASSKNCEQVYFEFNYDFVRSAEATSSS